jgi:uncharacterized membrane protein
MDFFIIVGLLLLAFPILAIVALVRTINIAERLRGLEARLAALELRGFGVPSTAPIAPAAVQPPPPPRPEPAAPAATAPLEPPPIPEPPPVRQPPPPPVRPAVATPPEYVASFEERFGTRWTVWIGGVALALGGIFLV